MEKSVVDSTMTGNLQYFKENYAPYKNNSNSLWEGIRDVLKINSTDPDWLKDCIVAFSDAISLNEDYFLGQMVTIKQQVTQRFAPEGQTNIVEGLSVAGDSSSTYEVKVSKERKLYYDKVTNTSYEEIIRRVHTTQNEGNTNFNLKFN
tara:strand:- start:1561 stop:2004 length:444 start_codon:yes stop_codon:yes gene_type:complete